MRNARAHKLQWSGPTVHSSTVAVGGRAIEEIHTEDYLRDKSVRCLFDCVSKCVCKWRVHVWPPCS